MSSSNIRQRDTKLNEAANGVVETQPRNITNSVTDSKESQPTKCSRLHESCVRCCIPCLKSHNPLQEHPNLLQRLRHAFMLPPGGNLAFYIQFVIVCIQIWVVLYAFTKGEALPGGNFFSLLVLFVCCAVGGYLMSFIHLPPLLGMLIVGVMLRNIPVINVIGENIDTKWSGVLRKVALTVILTRAGLGLDVVKLKKLSFAVLRLAFMPSLAEIITVTIVSHFLLGFPWKWSMLLGCILGALSPAVTVPILVNLQDRKFGVAKGIPTMLLAAGGLDNVFCVTGFSVFFGIIFSEGDLAVTIIKGPIGVLVGIVYGFVAGLFMWYIPAKDSSNHLFYRAMLLFGFGLVAIFGSSLVGLSGAGPLGCLTTATVAAYKWRQQRKPGETDELAGVMALTWLIVQHFLFGLIGSAVNISDIQSKTAGYGIATLAVGLVARSAVSISVTMGTGFNMKERIFVTLTWIAKATVQAAIGGLALDRVKSMDNPDPEQEALATGVLTLAVLAIVICAPIGATLMSIIGPRVLVQGEQDEVEVEVRSMDKDTDANSYRESVSVDMEKESLDERPMSTRSLSIEDMENFRSELSIAIANNASKIKTEKESPSQSNEQSDAAYDGITDLTKHATVDNLANNDELELEHIDNGMGFVNPAYTEVDITPEENGNVVNVHADITDVDDVIPPNDDTNGVTNDVTNADSDVDLDYYSNNNGDGEIYKTVLNITMK